jgi:hypothetical protein
MNTNRNQKNLPAALLAIGLMIGSGVLLKWTITGLYYSSPSALTVILPAIASVLIYILGASFFGRHIQNGKYRSRGGLYNGVMFAFLLIAGGILMLAFNLNLFSRIWRTFLFSWPMLLFVLGAVHIGRNRYTPGVILSAIGGFFLMKRASVIFPDDLLLEQFETTYWPALIVLSGLFILLGILIGPGRFGLRRHSASWRDPYGAATSAEAENNDGKINYQVFFNGASEQVILDPVFRGGTIDVTFGGMELDLRRTTLAEGDTFLYVKATFGGVEITVPDHWYIEIHPKGFIGGTSDSRIKTIERDTSRKLILIAKATFGGIDIK